MVGKTTPSLPSQTPHKPTSQIKNPENQYQNPHEKYHQNAIKYLTYLVLNKRKLYNKQTPVPPP